MPGRFDANDQSYAKKGWTFVNGAWQSPELDGQSNASTHADSNRNHKAEEQHLGAWNKATQSFGGLNAEGSGMGVGTPGHNATNPAVNNSYGGTQNTNISAPTGYQDQARALQQSLLDQLHGVASGSVDTAAEKMLRQQYGNAMANNSGQSTNVRNADAAAVARSTRNTNSQLQGQQVGDAHSLQMQQAAQANAMMAQLYGQMNGQQGDYAALQGMQGNVNDLLNNTRGMNGFGNSMNQSIGNRQFATDQANTQLGIYGNTTAMNNANNSTMLQGGAAGLGALAQMYNGNANPYGAGNTNTGNGSALNAPDSIVEFGDK